MKTFSNLVSESKHPENLIRVLEKNMDPAQIFQKLDSPPTPGLTMTYPLFPREVEGAQQSGLYLLFVRLRCSRIHIYCIV